MTEKTQAMYAIVELFGHSRIAGVVSEQTFGGSSFVRVDVPEIRFRETDYDGERNADGTRPTVERAIQAHTRSFGPGAIYSINWCDEAAALAAAHSIKHQPVNPYSVQRALRENLPQEHSTRLLGSSVVESEADDEVPY